MIFSTSLAAAAIGLLASGSPSAQPAWQTDYRTALAQAAEQHKPLAVFIGRGGDGFTAVLGDQAVAADVGGALKANFVALYVDTATEAGTRVAKSFEMDRGLVISDPTAQVQAVRHPGALTQAQLSGYLSQPVTTVTTVNYLAPSAPVVTAPATVYGTLVVPANCPNGRCGLAAPVVNLVAPIFSGGCPNGRCPNAR